VDRKRIRKSSRKRSGCCVAEQRVFPAIDVAAFDAGTGQHPSVQARRDIGPELFAEPFDAGGGPVAVIEEPLRRDLHRPEIAGVPAVLPVGLDQPPFLRRRDIGRKKTTKGADRHP